MPTNIPETWWRTLRFCTQVSIGLFVVSHPFVMFFSDQICAMGFHFDVQYIAAIKNATDMADFEFVQPFIIFRLVWTPSLRYDQRRLMRSEIFWKFDAIDFVFVFGWHMHLTFAFLFANLVCNDVAAIVSLANVCVWLPFLGTPAFNYIRFFWPKHTESSVFRNCHISLQSCDIRTMSDHALVAKFCEFYQKSNKYM